MQASETALSRDHTTTAKLKKTNKKQTLIPLLQKKHQPIHYFLSYAHVWNWSRLDLDQHNNHSFLWPRPTHTNNSSKIYTCIHFWITVSHYLKLDLDPESGFSSEVSHSNMFSKVKTQNVPHKMPDILVFKLCIRIQGQDVDRFQISGQTVTFTSWAESYQHKYQKNLSFSSSHVWILTYLTKWTKYLRLKDVHPSLSFLCLFCIQQREEARLTHWKSGNILSRTPAVTNSTHTSKLHSKLKDI